MELYGLIGNPLGHSISPQLHRYIYRATGRRGAYYTPYEVAAESLEQVGQAMRTLGIRGLNVTIPYKQDILRQLDGISQEAREIGAVNTIKLDERGLWGYNTDAYGFVASLAYHGVEIRGKRFVICGMSGAGRAVIYGLKQAGAAEVTVASTDPAKGISYRELERSGGGDVIVNCTPLGMSPGVDRSIVGEAVLRKFGAAVDIVYNPLRTRFLKTAEQLGLTAVGGLYMLLFQGMRSHEIWTGSKLEKNLAGELYQELSRLV